MEKNIIKLGPLSIEECMELIPETLKNEYKQTSYINWDKAKAKYRDKID